MANEKRYQAAIREIDTYLSTAKGITETERQAVYNLKIRYKSRLTRLLGTQSQRQKYENWYQELDVAALSAQREKVLQLYYDGKVSRTLGTRLLQKVNYSEINALTDLEE
jgi:hypothetical protein